MELTRINVLLIDNYDSFTYNIAHYLRKYPIVKLQIVEANKVRLDNIASFDKIIFSPGPDIPRPGNVMESVLLNYSQNKSFLGVCLGLQAIYLFFGGRLRQLGEVVHGSKKIICKTSCSSRLFNDMPDKFEAGLYHSWIADPAFLPDSLEITAVSDETRIMGIRHKLFDIEAVQFHPESVMTPDGGLIFKNWLRN
jgi:anthranilate synthase component 2